MIYVSKGIFFDVFFGVSDDDDSFNVGLFSV